VTTSEEPVHHRAWCANRRVLLASIGGLGAGALLTACGDDATANSAAPTGAATSAAPASPGTAPSGGSQPSSGPLADTGDVPVGGGTLVGNVLLVQPIAGSFKAYDATCPHKGVRVNAPKDGVATCPAHASTFSIADGSRLAGPATRGLTEIAVSVQGAKILRS
jgi:nitrite reductase/ring-hydroxylating ferredoxin subunit